jgi:hypothetical protein
MARTFEPDAERNLLSLLRDDTRPQLRARVRSAVNAITADPRSPGFTYRSFIDVTNRQQFAYVERSNREEWAITWYALEGGDVHFVVIGPTTSL